MYFLFPRCFLFWRESTIFEFAVAADNNDNGFNLYNLSLSTKLNIPKCQCSFTLLKPSLHEQFLCDNFYLTIFICRSKPRLHKQFLCDMFYIFASLRPVWTSNFYLKTKHWRLGSMDNIKKIASFMCFLLHTDNFLYMAIS